MSRRCFFFLIIHVFFLNQLLCVQSSFGGQSAAESSSLFGKTFSAPKVRSSLFFCSVLLINFSLMLSGNAALPSAFQVDIEDKKADVQSLLQKIAAHYKESKEEKKREAEDLPSDD